MSVAAQLQIIRERISDACQRCGRDPSEVRIMAVSKFQDMSRVVEAMEAGLTLFGESRMQEASEKFGALAAQGIQPELHFIGTLQRNKAREAVGLCACIQSVDRLELAQELSKRATQARVAPAILFELHTGEETKAGYPDVDAILATIDWLLENQSGLRIQGLMTMAPLSADERSVRASFRSLAHAREEISKRFPELPLETLSMGMSGDFPIAIEEGSTLVRIGTALFGERR